MGASCLPALAEPKPLSPGVILAYSLANLGNGAFYALNNAVLPLFLRRFTGVSSTRAASSAEPSGDHQ